MSMTSLSSAPLPKPSTAAGQLRQSFPVKDLGKLDYFLGLEVKHQSDGLHLSQRKYIVDLLARTNMTQAKPMCTPMAAADKLSWYVGTPLSA
jgi:histone deacetylase 1/2